MERVIYNKFDKSCIPDLPRAVFNGRIFVINTVAEAKKAIDYLLAQNMLGIDTETKPSFRKGHTNLVSLLQVSTFDTCFLFRLNLIGFNEHVIRFLEDTTVPKIGLSLHDDIMSLHKRGEFTPGNMIDLQKIVGKVGIEDLSLQKIYANIFHQKISKSSRLSNWEADILTEGQKLYAATDAWACIMIYTELQKFIEFKNYRLIIKDPVPADEGMTQ